MQRMEIIFKKELTQLNRIILTIDENILQFDDVFKILIINFNDSVEIVLDETHVLLNNVSKFKIQIW